MATRECWSVCEHHGSPCLYTERGRSAIEQRQDPARCIKHKAILTWEHSLYGLTRDEAKKEVRRWIERAA